MVTGWTPPRCHRVWLAVAAAASLGLCSCPSGLEPDKDELDALADSGLAVARIYAAPVLYVDFAVHTWFVIKRADEPDFHRWEVFFAPGSPYGVVWEDRYRPTDDQGAGPSFLVAELSGPPAEPIVDFIETQSPHYPCRYFYTLLPGPNCNSYVQWAVTQSGWAVQLPQNAFGKEVPANCPAE